MKLLVHKTICIVIDYSFLSLQLFIYLAYVSIRKIASLQNPYKILENIQLLPKFQPVLVCGFSFNYVGHDRRLVVLRLFAPINPLLARVPTAWRSVPAACYGSVYVKPGKVRLGTYKFTAMTSCTSLSFDLTLELIIDLIIFFAFDFSPYRWCQLKSFFKCYFSRKQNRT